MEAARKTNRRVSSCSNWEQEIIHVTGKLNYNGLQLKSTGQRSDVGQYLSCSRILIKVDVQSALLSFSFLTSTRADDDIGVCDV